MKETLARYLEEESGLKIPNEDLLKKRSKISEQRIKIEQEIVKIVTQPENIVPFFVPGRLIKVKSDQMDWGWGILVNFTK